MIQELINKLRSAYYELRKRRMKSLFKECGKHFKIYGIPLLIHAQNISVGDGLELNHGSVLNATESKIIIGNNVTISANAQIIAASYDSESFIRCGKREHVNNPIIIGDFVWICAGAIILPGVHITGSHVIVAASAVVTSDIDESYVIVAGNPAKVVKRISIDSKGITY